jgi:hypothetical protein
MSDSASVGATGRAGVVDADVADFELAHGAGRRNQPQEYRGRGGLRYVSANGGR